MGKVFTPVTRNWRIVEDNGSPLEAENTKPTLSATPEKLNVVICCAETGDVNSTDTIAIEYSLDGSTGWTAMGAANHWNYYDGVQTDGAALTAGTYLSDTVDDGKYFESSQSFLWGKSDVLENAFVIEATGNETADQDYYFRVTFAGTPVPLDSGETYAQVRTSGTAVSSTTKNGTARIQKTVSTSLNGTANILDPDAVNYDNSAVGARVTNVITFSNFTIANNANRVLLVGVVVRGDQTISSVVWNTTETLTKIGQSDYGSTGSSQLFVALYRLTGPTATTADIVVTLSATPDIGAVAGAVSLYNVDQTNPVPTVVQENSYTGVTPNADITTANANTWIGDIWGMRLGLSTITADWTSRETQSVDSTSLGMQTRAVGSTSTYNLGWTIDSSAICEGVLYEVKPATGATNSTTKDGKGRVQKTVSSTKTGVGRVQKTSSTTRTGTANLFKQIQTTQTGLARIQKTISDTLDGTGRISKTESTALNGVAKIVQQIQESLSGIARIQKSIADSLSGTGRIEKTVADTLDGLARIEKTVSDALTGLARIQKTVTDTLNGTARIQKSITTTRTGVANIQTTGTSQITKDGLARIQRTEQETLNGTARIEVTSSDSLSGTGRIQRTEQDTKTGLGRIQRTESTFLNGVANIQITGTVQTTKDGLGRIQRTESSNLSGTARIARTEIDTLQGTARVQKSSQSAQTGLTRVQKSITKALTALSRIQRAVSTTKTGVANIIVTGTVQTTKDGLGRIQRTEIDTLAGTGRIQRTASLSVFALSRLEKTVSSSLTGSARITSSSTTTLTGVANILGKQTNSTSLTGKACIVGGYAAPIGKPSPKEEVLAVEEEPLIIVKSEALHPTYSMEKTHRVLYDTL